MLRMFRPYNFSWIAGCFSVTMAPRYEMCVGMEKGHKTTKNVQKVEFFNFVKCVQPVLRIHLILMRIRILNPHWKKMDPDPGYFFWWTIQKWGHFYNLYNSGSQKLADSKHCLNHPCLSKLILGGPDPLDYITVYSNQGNCTHWHYVSSGLSDLHGDGRGVIKKIRKKIDLKNIYSPF